MQKRIPPALATKTGDPLSPILSPAFLLGGLIESFERRLRPKSERPELEQVTEGVTLLC